jgi:protein-disulfide isomerase
MNSQYVIPVTIVVAGALIAGGIFFAGKSAPSTNETSQQENVRAYTPGVDHIMGNPNAAVKIVEYIDLECPYCKELHNTMYQVMDFYSENSNVAWVVRPFPLASIHSKAPKEAEAAECAAAQGGDAAFFRYIDRVFKITPSNNGLDLAQLPVIAKDVGLNVDTFNSCMSAGTYAKKISDSYNEAISIGAQGTPYTLLMVGDQSVVLKGAQPYDSMRAAIDAVLGQLPANTQ